MRMPDTEGVLFDYGRTLVTFTPYPKDELLAVIREYRPRIESAMGLPAPEAESILRDVLQPLEAYVSSESEDEVDYVDVYRDTWHGAGLKLPDDLLHQILDSEQQVWDRSVRVDPDTPIVLTALRERGLRLGICSNAPFPPAMMRRQMETNGIAAMVDAIVFSSEVGKRKPSPELYRAALDAIGTPAEKTVFVGDRMREDYEGPRAAGMRAVIVTAHAENPPADGIPHINRLAELLPLV
jgi:HAD superfamily hydrolase (TIGR01549 family)